MRFRATTSIVVAFLLSFWVGVSVAQTAPNASARLSPQAAYEQAQRPFEIVRRASSNWSEIELDAYKVATGQAKTSCMESASVSYSGDDLLAYARLCAFGQAWEIVETAAQRYIQAAQVAVSAGTPVPMRSLSTAFDYDVQAALRLKKAEEALHACQAMLRAVPYDEFAADATDAAVPFLQFSNLDDALSLLQQRQVVLLPMLHGAAPGATVTPVLSVPTLYAEAIALPTMQQYAGQLEAAAVAYAEVEQNLPATLVPDDALAVEQSRSRYHLLGSPLPKLDSFVWLMDSSGHGVPPELNAAVVSATVLLLFPDWCTQCVGTHPQFVPEWRRLSDQRVRFFALLAQAQAPAKVGPTEAAGKAPASARLAPFAGEKPGTPHNDLQLDVKPTAAGLLAGTPTFVVPNKTLKTFAATDFPLIIVTDRDGIVRAMQMTNESALDAGGQIDQMAAHVNEVWPGSKP